MSKSHGLLLLGNLNHASRMAKGLLFIWWHLGRGAVWGPFADFGIKDGYKTVLGALIRDDCGTLRDPWDIGLVEEGFKNLYQR